MTMFRLRFYADLERHHPASPSRVPPDSFATAEEAEAVAQQLLPELRARYGPLAGYAVVASNGRPVTPSKR
jgi:hypothetical protein